MPLTPATLKMRWPPPRTTSSIVRLEGLRHTPPPGDSDANVSVYVERSARSSGAARDHKLPSTRAPRSSFSRGPSSSSSRTSASLHASSQALHSPPHPGSIPYPVTRRASPTSTPEHKRQRRFCPALPGAVDPRCGGAHHAPGRLLVLVLCDEPRNYRTIREQPQRYDTSSPSRSDQPGNRAPRRWVGSDDLPSQLSGRSKGIRQLECSERTTSRMTALYRASSSAPTGPPLIRAPRRFSWRIRAVRTTVAAPCSLGWTGFYT